MKLTSKEDSSTYTLFVGPLAPASSMGLVGDIRGTPAMYPNLGLFPYSCSAFYVIFIIINLSFEC